MSEKLLPCHKSKRLGVPKTHGHGSKWNPSSTYQSWNCMRARCKYKSRHNFAKYYILGYCKEWESFSAFLSDMGERPAGTTLDRIDTSLGYSKDNCKWSTATEQARNRIGPTNKITLEQAMEIKRRRLLGEKCKEIASDYNISESLVKEIHKGRTWKDA